VAWERRGDNFYYYQSERKGGRIRKKYIGSAAGELAHTIAHADETIRRHRKERAARDRAQLEEMQSLASSADEVDEAAQTLAVAELVAAGYHRHKGQWRLKRG
jgi:hypothetical protein